ncbi:Fanconi anemia core complex-associated protein 100 [Anguilla rostrata]|uniref:Fanconi anemia core complex-associated protein 100 n=1 Tax=Anguilla rostrata TaxID=7938 RepID=UPI0030CCDC49
MTGMRCSVKSLAEFQASSKPAQVIRFGTEPKTVISNGTSQVFTCSGLERGVTETHTFSGRVTQLVPSADGHGVYVLCERDGVYFTSLPQQPRTLSSRPPGGDSPSPACFRVVSESCVIRDPQIRSFVVTEKVLVAVALGDGVWQFGLYEIPGDASSCYRRLAELSVPAVSTAGPSAAARADRQGALMLPVLCCVCAQGGRSGAGGGDGHFLLEPVLFRLLFGVDASLLSSPMILCGLPDGRLCCLPLLLPGGSEVRGQGCRVRVLHSLEQPIRFIGSSVAMGGGPTCLVVVGRGGAVLQVWAEEGPEGAVAGFEERRVQGPVECACVSDTHLYYSTCTDLLALSLARSPSPDTDSNLPHPAVQTPLSLNVTRVIGLATPTQDPSGAVQLLCVSLTGRLLEVTLPEETDSSYASLVSAAQVGQRISDLLAGIGHVAHRASSLEDSIQSKRTALRSLNHVLNVCSLLRPNQEGEDTAQQQPIRCRVAVRWASSLQQDCLMLSCVLENSSSFVLESGWALCLQLAPLSRAPHTQGGPPVRTYTFPLKTLTQNGSMEETLPLAGEDGLSLPLMVRSWLVYSLQGMLGLRDAGGDGCGCLSLPLNCETLDWLDCLHLDCPPGPTNAPGPAPGSGSGADLVQTFLSSRGAEPRQGGAAGVSQGGAFAASVRVSCGGLKTTLGMEPTPNALLGWLLSDARGFQRGGQGCPPVYAHGPGGDALKLTAKEVTVSQVCGGGPVCAVELRVESASLRAVCVLHHALLRRLQVLFKEVATTTEPPLQLQGQRLQQVLLEAEALCEEIQESRAPAALGVAQPERIAHKLIQAYQRLREGLLLCL